MKEDWEIFDGQPYRRNRSKELRVTLGHGSTFYLNRVAWEALGQPAAVELMYKGNSRVIGMRRTDPQLRNAFAVRNHTSGHYKRVSAGAFCKHFRLRTRGTILFDKAELLDSGVLALPMDSVVTVGRGSR